MTSCQIQYSPIRPAALCNASLGFFTLAFLSWVPSDYRLSTLVLSGTLEYALAYLLLGLMAVVAGQQTRNVHQLFLAIVAFAGGLELGKLIIPRRVASLEISWSLQPELSWVFV